MRPTKVVDCLLPVIVLLFVQLSCNRPNTTSSADPANSAASSNGATSTDSRIAEVARQSVFQTLGQVSPPWLNANDCAVNNPDFYQCQSWVMIRNSGANNPALRNAPVTIPKAFNNISVDIENTSVAGQTADVKLRIQARCVYRTPAQAFGSSLECSASETLSTKIVVKLQLQGGNWNVTDAFEDPEIAGPKEAQQAQARANLISQVCQMAMNPGINAGAAKAFLDSGGDPNACKDSDGRNLLMLAAMRGGMTGYADASALIESGRIDLNSKDRFGYPAVVYWLIRARQSNYENYPIELVKSMINRGADKGTWFTPDGQANWANIPQEFSFGRVPQPIKLTSKEIYDRLQRTTWTCANSTQNHFVLKFLPEFDLVLTDERNAEQRGKYDTMTNQLLLYDAGYFHEARGDFFDSTITLSDPRSGQWNCRKSQ